MIDTTKFNNQLASTLACWVMMLRDGRSLKQVLAGFALDAPEPTATVMGDTLKDVEATGDLVGAIRRMSERIDSSYLDRVVQVVMEHRETGGNLAEVLEDVIAELGDDITGEKWFEI